MKAIILAAGRGSRMNKLTEEIPKCLLEIGGKSLLSKQIESLRGAGINEIAIVTGYRRELLVDFGLIEFNNARWAETNMVCSLACAAEWLELEPCVVSYSDILYDSTAVISLINNYSELAVTYDPNWLELWTSRFENPLVDAETFRKDERNIIKEISNKPNSIDEIQGQYMGLLRFTPSVWKKFVDLRSSLDSKTCDNLHMTGALQLLIEQGYKQIKAIPYYGKWAEFDSSNDFKIYS